MIPDSWRDDAALLKRAASGERSAAATLVQRLMPPAHALAWRMTANAAAAEDIVQEAFIRLWQTAGRWEPRASVGTFFTRIVINLCYDHHRSHSAEPVADPDIDEVEDESGDILDSMAAKESRAEIRAALYRLSPRHRAVLVMWAYSEMNVREIATALDMTQNAVHQLLFRARAALRAQVENAKQGRGKSHVG
jgi:RNA polymerase sigma-70 factor (ECF subfamily)